MSRVGGGVALARQAGGRVSPPNREAGSPAPGRGAGLGHTPLETKSFPSPLVHLNHFLIQ